MKIFTALISPCSASVFKIFLFPDSHNTDNQLVLNNPERRPVFTNPEPVPWLFGRASSYFLHVLTMKRVRSILLKRDLNSDACRLGQRCEGFLCPVGKFYPGMPSFYQGSDRLIITKIFHNVPQASDTPGFDIFFTRPDVFNLFR